MTANLQPHLQSVLQGTRATLNVNAQFQEEVLEGPPNGAWRAARGKPEFGIDFERPDGSSVGFEYSSLVRREFRAGQILLTFLADEMVRVTIVGRGLRQLYELIRGHRVAVVHVAARDMAPDGEPVVTEVRVEKVIAERID
jgi:hypothetical protein